MYNYEKKAEVDYDSFRYYDPDKQGLRIYRNQLDNENKIGFIDLRDKSILDSNVEIIDDSLLLLHKNNTLAKVENWNTYQHARKMIFAFNNTIVSNAKCVISACDSEDIVEEFMFIKEIKKLMNKKGGYGYTLLHYAVQEGNLNLVTFLLDSGADANAQDESSYGKKPIHIAAENNDKDIIDLLIKKGARVNDTDKNCWTPLHYAASGGQLEAARFLVDRGADINAVEASTDGKKPIHVAAMGGYENVIEFFISKGINVNDVATGNGRTPLHYAAWQGIALSIKVRM
ncbi:ankyrin repeat domain-containing protein [Wolbachia endosymbiont (group A) of Sphecodes monilicornis]|uniref:ankyrin repeat domain-containing protein n=1 Tax=Wolbachia endosymbiont (group A) of Sphecodes monilicornis TaxID=2954060 RepID=UPI002226C0A5|nr:ankyrin repeat domain-containing protein [Wolbachia endosymbiont (group A) of Sphecodes monilicornis]